MRNRAAILCLALILVTALLPVMTTIAVPLVAVAIVAIPAAIAVRLSIAPAAPAFAPVRQIVRSGHAPRASLSR